MKKLVYFLFGALVLCLLVIAYYPTLSAEPELKVPPPETPKLNSVAIEKMVFDLINLARERENLAPTKWDDKLYNLSLSHTQKMADGGKLFHTPIEESYAECCWGGKGYYLYDGKELPQIIVNSWLSSPLHRAWILHKPLQTSVVSIVITPNGQYASWTFWNREAGMGPPLIQKIYNEWQYETDGNIPWLEFLKSKGYIENSSNY